MLRDPLGISVTGSRGVQALSQHTAGLQGQSPRSLPVIVAAASWAGQKDGSRASNGPVPEEKMPATLQAKECHLCDIIIFLASAFKAVLFKLWVWLMRASCRLDGVANDRFIQ